MTSLAWTIPSLTSSLQHQSSGQVQACVMLRVTEQIHIQKSFTEDKLAYEFPHNVYKMC